MVVTAVVASWALGLTLERGRGAEGGRSSAGQYVGRPKGLRSEREGREDSSDDGELHFRY